MIVMKACWNITSKCNRKCRYCFKFNEKDLSLDENEKILDKLISLGVNEISWSGGEPFLYDDFQKLLKLSKEKGLLNYVNTNATLLNRTNLLDNINNIDKLIISLDFVDDTLNEKYGIGTGYYAHIKDILTQINESNFKIEIQLNTVLFSKNIHYIDELYNEICKYNIDYWKILRFWPVRGKALKEKNKLSITDRQFKEFSRKYQNKNQNFKIRIQNFDELEERHFIVLSSGEVVYSENGKDIRVAKKLI